MERHEPVRRSEEGSFLFQSDDDEHDSSPPFLELCHVHECSVCDFSCPLPEPFSPSLRDPLVAGLVQGFEANPDHCVPT